MKKKPSLFTPVIFFLLTLTSLEAATIINETLIKKMNTDGDETSCTFTENQRLVIFARKPKGKNDSDLYFTEYKKDEWSDIAPLNELNSESDDITPNISPDGKFILFSSNRNGSLKSNSSDRPSYDIYFSEKKGETWEKPELLFGAVNTHDDETNPFISENGKTLYFTRSRPDNPASSKIIKVHYRKGSWEDIQTADISKNSDKSIYSYKKSIFKNGAYLAAFINNDSSSRDIYYAEIYDNRAAEITSIDPINTPGDEISVTETDNDTVIVSTNTDGISGSYDFFLKNTGTYNKNVPRKQKKNVPVNYTLIIEKANDAVPENTAVMIIFFSSLKNDSTPVKTEFKSANASGLINFTSSIDTKRVLVLPVSSDIKPFAVEFFTDNDSITTSTIKIEPAGDKNFTVKPVYFDFNSSSLKIADIPYIYELIGYMKKNENIKLLLSGYADGIGSYKTNLEISITRAETIKDYLIKAGIKEERIVLKGYGFIKTNDSDTSQFHRRVDFELTDK